MNKTAKDRSYYRVGRWRYGRVVYWHPVFGYAHEKDNLCISDRRNSYFVKLPDFAISEIEWFADRDSVYDPIITDAKESHGQLLEVMDAELREKVENIIYAEECEADE